MSDFYDDNEPMEREAKNHGGLDDWFKREKWVRVDAPKKKGKYQPCGRANTTKGKKPVCVPVNKAKNLTEKERKNRIRQKRQKEKEPNPDKKPNVTKYSPSAGGKSNVSDSHNIRFVGSMIPLSDLKPNQPKFIKISGIEDEGGIGNDNPLNPLEEMKYEERDFGQEPSPEEKDQYKPFFINMYFPYYKSLITNILTSMLEDSKYYNILEFRSALNQKEPEAINLFLRTNEYLSGTSKSTGGSAMAQIVCMNLALNAKKFVDTGIDIFNFDNKESSDVEAAWELVSSGNFFEHQLEESNVRFSNSQLPSLAQPKFVKIALMGEEEDIPSTDISGMFSENDDKISSMAEQIQEEAFTQLAEILSHNMGLNGPDESIISSIKFYENPVQEEMTEREYLRFIRHKREVAKNLFYKAKESKDSKMFEITFKMIERSVNPFNYAEVAQLVREVIDKPKKIK